MDSKSGLTWRIPSGTWIGRHTASVLCFPEMFRNSLLYMALISGVS